MDAQRRAAELQQSLEEFALSLPEAWMDSPWGDEHVTKVRKKIFVFYGGDEPSISVKLVDLLHHGRNLPGATPTGYGLGRHGWTSIPLAGMSESDAEAMVDFIEESYRCVAPKTLVTMLDASGGSAAG